MSRTLFLLPLLSFGLVHAHAQGVLTPVWERAPSVVLTTPRIAVGPDDSVVVGGSGTGVVQVYDALGRTRWSASGQPGGANQTDVAISSSGEVLATYNGHGPGD